MPRTELVFTVVRSAPEAPRPLDNRDPLRIACQESRLLWVLTGMEGNQAEMGLLNEAQEGRPAVVIRRRIREAL
jgi:hypothetical protein